MRDDVMVHYLRWLRAQVGDEPICLYCDSFDAHWAQRSTTEAARLQIEMKKVPEGMTDLLQPCDRRVFGVLKSISRHKWNVLYVSDPTVRWNRRIGAELLEESWNELPTHVILDAWDIRDPDEALADDDQDCDDDSCDEDFIPDEHSWNEGQEVPFWEDDIDTSSLSSDVGSDEGPLLSQEEAGTLDMEEAGRASPPEGSGSETASGSDWADSEDSIGSPEMSEWEPNEPGPDWRNDAWRPGPLRRIPTGYTGLRPRDVLIGEDWVQEKARLHQVDPDFVRSVLQGVASEMGIFWNMPTDATQAHQLHLAATWRLHTLLSDTE